MSTLPDYPEIEYILALQEGVAMGMADGYACASGTIPFVNLHIETGLANGISLLHHAWDGGTPLVLSAGNKDIRKLAEGRSNLVEMVRQFTKWSAEITHPAQIPNVVRRAFREARTPPTGPTFFSFSTNALEDEADVSIETPDPIYPRIAPDKAALAEAVGLIAHAHNPIVVLGDRVAHSGAQTQAVKLAEQIGARVYTTSHAQVCFPSGHPQFFGRISPALPDGRIKLAKADVVIAVGTNVFSGFFYAQEAALDRSTVLIHIDNAGAEIGKVQRTQVGILADPKVALEQLCSGVIGEIPHAEQNAILQRVAAMLHDQRQLDEAWEVRVRQRWNVSPMSPERMMSEVARALPADAIVIDDSLSNKETVHAAMKFNEPGSLYGERIGAIGWGMGAALGVKLAKPGRPVVAIVGDGSAMMTVQALWTAANYNIAAVYVVCNNSSYRILKQNMRIYKDLLRQELPSRYVGMDFPLRLDLAAIANAIGVQGRTISDPSELGPALHQALESGHPAVLDVIIDGGL